MVASESQSPGLAWGKRGVLELTLQAALSVFQTLKVQEMKKQMLHLRKVSPMVLALAVAVVAANGVDPTKGPPDGQILPAATGLGSMSGSTSVGVGGGLSWSTSLEVPTGPGGMTPSIGIAYTGDGYGALGWGFSLQGTDLSITRCRETLGHEGRNAPIRWLKTDALCLGGERLLAVEGEHGGHGVEYRVGSKESLRIRSRGESVAWDSGFTLYYPDGRVVELGAPAVGGWDGASQLARFSQPWPGGNERVPLSWNVRRERDRWGNEIEYSYEWEEQADFTEDALFQVSYRLKSIRYGRNAQAGVDHTRELVFGYVPASVYIPKLKFGAEAVIRDGYLSGVAYRHSMLLRDVVTRVSGQDVKRYRLAYSPLLADEIEEVEQGASWMQDGAWRGMGMRVRLESLQECSPLPSSACKGATRFAWTRGGRLPTDGPDPRLGLEGHAFDGVQYYDAISPDAIKEKAWLRRPSQTIHGDFNGDGRLQILVAPQWHFTGDGPGRYGKDSLFPKLTDAEAAERQSKQASERWELWSLDAASHAPVKTNVPAPVWKWHSRVGMQTVSDQLFDTDKWYTPDVNGFRRGFERDPKAVTSAWAANVDGSYGTDVIVGSPLIELGGLFMDPPYGLGSMTVTDLWTLSPTYCWPMDVKPWMTPEEDGTEGFPYLSLHKQKHCLMTVYNAARAREDFYGHPGVMSDLEVMSLKPGTEAEFERSSTGYSLKDGRALLWVQPADINGDGLTDVVMCRSTADYASTIGESLPYYYGVQDSRVNWVSGEVYYSLNRAGHGLNLSDGGLPSLDLNGSRRTCHLKDALYVADLYGDGRDAVLQYRPREVGQLDVHFWDVPDGELGTGGFGLSDTVKSYIGKLRQVIFHQWKEGAQGQFYDALSFDLGKGLVVKPTTLPFDAFMRWQGGGNRFSLYQPSRSSDPNYPDYGSMSVSPDIGSGANTRYPRLVGLTDPYSVDLGFGLGEARWGDFNGDGLLDVAYVELEGPCRRHKDPGFDALGEPSPPSLSDYEPWACSWADIIEWDSSGPIEKTFEQVVLVIYYNRGDGSFDRSSGIRLWESRLDSAAETDVLLKGKTGQNVVESLFYNQAWAKATRAAREWRAELGSMSVTDANGDGVADLAFLDVSFIASSGVQFSRPAGKHTIRPSVLLGQTGRRGPDMLVAVAPMSVDMSTLEPDAVENGWPAWTMSGAQAAWQGWQGAPAVELDMFEVYERGFGARFILADVDRDGATDMLLFDHVRSRWQFSKGLPGADVAPNLLKRVTDGVGAVVEADYAVKRNLLWSPYTLEDLTLPYPLVSRPSTAPAVSLLRRDTGLDLNGQRDFVKESYRYGRDRVDVQLGASLGPDVRQIVMAEGSSSGQVVTWRLEYYNNQPIYAPTFKAYPEAGSLLRVVTWVDALDSEGNAEPVWLTQQGFTYSTKPGQVAGTWNSSVEAEVATTYELPASVSGADRAMIISCLSSVMDPTTQCALDQSKKHFVPMSYSRTGYTRDAFGFVTQEQVQTGLGEARSVLVSTREYVHNLNLSNYALGMLVKETQANYLPGQGGLFELRTASHSYAANNARVSTTIEPDRPEYRYSESLRFDWFGNVVERRRLADGVLQKTSYSYTPSGVFPAGKTNALGHSTTAVWFEGCGLPMHETDVRGHTTVHDIDTLCRPRGSQLWFGDKALGPKTSITYGQSQWADLGTVADVKIEIVAQVDGGGSTRSVMDRLGRTIVSQSPSLGFDVYARTRYDRLGRVDAVSLPTRVGEQPLGDTKTRYDGKGRVIAVIKPDGSAKRTVYERHVTRGIDELGNTGEVEVNMLGQVIRTSPAMDHVQDTSMCYRYGIWGSLLEASPCTQSPSKGPATMSYDLYGRLLTRHDAQSGLHTMSYDALGRLVGSEDAEGRKVEYRYDLLDRMVQRIEDAGTNDAKSSFWHYDELLPGMLAQSINADGTVVEAPIVDEFNRVAGRTLTIHGISYVTRHGFDNRGRVATEDFPTPDFLHPLTVSHTYNDLDQRIGMSYKNQVLWQVVESDVWGQATRQRFGNSVEATLSNHPLTGRPQSSEVSRLLLQGAGIVVKKPLQRFEYQWQDNGLLLSRTSLPAEASVATQQESYQYTARGQLKRWDIKVDDQGQSLQRAYMMRYDPFGAIEESPNGFYAYAGERLLTVGGKGHSLAYDYDLNGNVVSRVYNGKQSTLKYDALGRVVSLLEGDAEKQITYSADGEKVRVANLSTGQETYYVGTYQEERGGTLGATVIGRYALGPAHVVRTWTNGAPSETVDYVAPADWLGSVTLVTSALGQVKDARSYDPWGQERNPSNWTLQQWAPANDALGLNVGFTGHERRSFSGLMDMRARYYDPVAYRMVQADSMVPQPMNPLDWNRYAYVRNSPTAYTDPTGHAPQHPLEKSLFNEHGMTGSMIDFIAFADGGFTAGGMVYMGADAAQAATAVLRQSNLISITNSYAEAWMAGVGATNSGEFSRKSKKEEAPKRFYKNHWDWKKSFMPRTWDPVKGITHTVREVPAQAPRTIRMPLGFGLSVPVTLPGVPETTVITFHVRYWSAMNTDGVALSNAEVRELIINARKATAQAHDVIASNSTEGETTRVMIQFDFERVNPRSASSGEFEAAVTLRPTTRKEMHDKSDRGGAALLQGQMKRDTNELLMTRRVDAGKHWEWTTFPHEILHGAGFRHPFNEERRLDICNESIMCYGKNIPGITASDALLIYEWAVNRYRTP